MENARRGLSTSLQIRAPPWKPTPVRLSCITTDKAQQDQSHWDDVPVPLNSKPIYRLPSETCNSISASCNALEIISLQRKQTEKEILQFSATPYTGHFFFLFSSYIKHSPQWELQGQLNNFLQYFPCTALYQAGVPAYLDLVIPQSFSLKINFRWLFKHKPHSQLFLSYVQEKEHVSNSRRKKAIFYLQHNHMQHAKQAQLR